MSFVISFGIISWSAYITLHIFLSFFLIYSCISCWTFGDFIGIISYTFCLYLLISSRYSHSFRCLVSFLVLSKYSTLAIPILSISSGLYHNILPFFNTLSCIDCRCTLSSFRVCILHEPLGM